MKDWDGESATEDDFDDSNGDEYTNPGLAYRFKQEYEQARRRGSPRVETLGIPARNLASRINVGRDYPDYPDRRAPEPAPSPVPHLYWR